MNILILRTLRGAGTCFCLLLVLSWPSVATAQTSPFPIPAGLEGAVEFWKQVFSRYSFADVILFEPDDPATIYGVVRAPENEQGRALVTTERAREMGREARAIVAHEHAASRPTTVAAKAA
jgi:hypothetical protein